MKVTTTNISGLCIIEPVCYKDDRGYFMETYRHEKLIDTPVGDTTFVQDNESYSTYGVIRGLHYQDEPHAQAKLIRVFQGTIFDVAVDLRPNSPTWGQWFGVELSFENKKSFFIPRGFAHGFCVLSPHSLIGYKCDNYYNAACSKSVAFDDPDLDIPWPIPQDKRIISKNDLNGPSLHSLK